MSETVKCLADRADEIIEVTKTKENSSDYLTALLIAAINSVANSIHLKNKVLTKKARKHIQGGHKPKKNKKENV